MNPLFYYTLFLKMYRKDLLNYCMNRIERLEGSSDLKKSLQIATASYFNFFLDLQQGGTEDEFHYKKWLAVFKQVISIPIEPHFSTTLHHAVNDILKHQPIPHSEEILEYHNTIIDEIAKVFHISILQPLRSPQLSYINLGKLEAFSEQLNLHNGTEDLPLLLIQAEKILNFKRVMFFSYNPWLESFEGVLGAEMEKVERMRGKIETEPVFAMKKPIYLKEPAPFVQKIAIDLFNLSSTIFIPVQNEDQLFGWLSFDQKGETFECSTELLPLLEEVGKRLGIYLNRKQNRTKFNYSLELSDKEMLILNLLVEGYSNKEIAQYLYLSEFTVRDYLKNLMVKLNAKNRTHLLSRAFRMGLVD